MPVLVLGARYHSILRSGTWDLGSGTKFGSSRHTSRAASRLRSQCSEKDFENLHL